MDDKKITELPELSTISPEDIIPVIDGPESVAENKRLAISKLDERYFDADNHVDGDTNKVFTAVEQSKLNSLSSVHPSYPQLFPRKRPIEVDDLASGWVDYFANGTTAHDDTVYFQGAGSIKIITSTNNALCGMSKEVAMDLTGKDLRVWLRSTDWSNVALAQVRMYTDESNFFYLDIAQFFQDKVDDEWFDCQLSKSRFYEYGDPDWSDINLIVLNANSPTGETSTVWYDGLAIYESAIRPAISICFDDSRTTGYSIGAKYMESKGLVGTMFTIPTLLGTANYMTQAEVDDLHRKGWDISGHGEFNLSTLTEDQADADLRATYEYLSSHGYVGSNIYAYPNGANDNSIRSLVSKYFSVARTINYINQPLGSMNPMRLNALSPISSWTYANIKTYIDFAIENNEWLILVFHNITASPTVTTDVSTEIFQQVIDYIDGLGIETLPISNIIQRDWMMPKITVGDVEPSLPVKGDLWITTEV